MTVRNIPRRGLLAAVLCLGLLVVPGGRAAASGDGDRVARRYAGPSQPTAEADSTSGRPGAAPPLPAGIPTAPVQAAASQASDAPAAGRAYGLAQCVARALAANPQMRSVRTAFAGSEEARRQALANFGPVGTATYAFKRTDSQVHSTKSLTLPTGTVMIHAQTGRWQNTYTLALQATQPLFTGFNLLSAYQKAALNKDYAAANIQYTELSLVKSVQQAFLGLLQARANAQSNKDSVIRLAAQYKVAQAYYDEGIKAHLDMLQAESDLATAEQSLLAAENAVRIQTAQLNTLLNLPLDQETDYVGELTYIPFSLSLDACLEAAYRKRPDLAMGIKSVQMAEKSVMIAASPLYPQVQAQVTDTKAGNQPDLRLKDMSGRTTPDTSQWTLSASLQAWDSGSTIFATRAARETVRKLQADLAKLRLDAGAQVKTAYLNIQDAAKRIAVARTAVDASQEGYRSAVALYQEQVGTNTEVLDAQYRLSTAETDLTQALTDYQSALADLYAAIGLQNPSLLPQ